MRAQRDISRNREALRIGGQKNLLAVNEHAPVGGQHPIGTCLEDESKILIEAEICKNSIANIAKIDPVANACTGIRLNGTELSKMVLKKPYNWTGARTAKEDRAVGGRMRKPGCLKVQNRRHCRHECNRENRGNEIACFQGQSVDWPDHNVF